MAGLDGRGLPEAASRDAAQRAAGGQLRTGPKLPGHGCGTCCAARRSRGALGTGSAAVVSGFLGRGQARMQLRAEHARLLREPRRSAYVAFAQGFQEVHALHTEAAKSASAVVEAEEPDRSRLLSDAHGAYTQAGDRLYGEFQPAVGCNGRRAACSYSRRVRGGKRTAHLPR